MLVLQSIRFKVCFFWLFQFTKKKAEQKKEKKKQKGRKQRQIHLKILKHIFKKIFRAKTPWSNPHISNPHNRIKEFWSGQSGYESRYLKHSSVPESDLNLKTKTLPLPNRFEDPWSQTMIWHKSTCWRHQFMDWLSKTTCKREIER